MDPQIKINHTRFLYYFLHFETYKNDIGLAKSMPINRQSVRDASISKNEDFELKCTEWLLWKVFMPN